MWSNWALGSITMNKANAGDGIPVELFQILKDNAMKTLHSICQQIWKAQQWRQDWKRSVFIPISKKGNVKESSNYCTTALISLEFSSVTQSYPTLCNPVNYSTSGLPVHHQLPEFTQTHIHRVGDAIQQSHPLSSPSPPAPNPSQHQSLFQLFAWGGQSTGVSALASFLPKNTQEWSALEWTGWISLQSKRLSRVFSNTTVQKHQFFGTQLSSQSNSHIHTRLLEKP